MEREVSRVATWQLNRLPALLRLRLLIQGPPQMHRTKDPMYSITRERQSMCLMYLQEWWHIQMNIPSRGNTNTGKTPTSETRAWVNFFLLTCHIFQKFYNKLVLLL